MTRAKIVIKYRPSQPDTEITVLYMELADGLAEITWDTSVMSTGEDGSVLLEGHDLYLEEEDRDITSQTLAGARITDALWRVKNGNWYGGSVEILSAQITMYKKEFPVEIPDTLLPRAIDYAKLDPGVRDLVQYFNDAGLHTAMSCDGSSGHGYGFLWVEFHPSVNEVDLRVFMANHTPKGKEYTGNGWFGSRCVLDKTFGTSFARQFPVYMASNPEAVRKDMETWKAMDAKRKEHLLCGLQ